LVLCKRGKLWVHP